MAPPDDAATRAVRRGAARCEVAHQRVRHIIRSTQRRARPARVRLVAAGGRTVFPKLAMRFPPERGNAVVWYNLDRHGTPDERTLHAGEPVTEGEKWGMNIWLRERPKQRSRRCHAKLSVAAAGADGAPRVALSLRPAASQAATAIAPCRECGDPVGPLGLCFCKRKYGFK